MTKSCKITLFVFSVFLVCMITGAVIDQCRFLDMKAEFNNAVIAGDIEKAESIMASVSDGDLKLSMQDELKPAKKYAHMVEAYKDGKFEEAADCIPELENYRDIKTYTYHIGKALMQAGDTTGQKRFLSRSGGFWTRTGY